MKYMLSHRTSYSYASSVDSAHHIAHLRAREFPGQKVTSIGIETDPAPALAVQHIDHFGNLITNVKRADLTQLAAGPRDPQTDVAADVRVVVGETDVGPVRRTYGEWMVPGLGYRIVRELLKRGLKVALPLEPRGPAWWAALWEGLRARALRLRIALYTCHVIGTVAEKP